MNTIRALFMLIIIYALVHYYNCYVITINNQTEINDKYKESNIYESKQKDIVEKSIDDIPNIQELLPTIESPKALPNSVSMMWDGVTFPEWT